MIMTFFCTGCQQTFKRDVSKTENQQDIIKDADGKIVGYRSRCDKAQATIMCEPVTDFRAVKETMKKGAGK